MALSPRTHPPVTPQFFGQLNPHLSICMYFFTVLVLYVGNRHFRKGIGSVIEFPAFSLHGGSKADRSPGWSQGQNRH